MFYVVMFALRYSYFNLQSKLKKKKKTNHDKWIGNFFVVSHGGGR